MKVNLILGIGDFYYELGVQIVEVCLATNYKNGGLITLEELRTRLIAARGKAKIHQDITNEDLLAAIKKLKIFGNGYVQVFHNTPLISYWSINQYNINRILCRSFD